MTEQIISQTSPQARKRCYAHRMYTLVHLAVLAVTILVLERALPDVQIRRTSTALAVAVVFSVLNFFLGWLIRAFLFVPAILTLGLLFLILPFVVNTILLWLTNKVMSTFKIHTLGSLLMSAGAITAVNTLMHFVLRSIAAGQMHEMMSPGPTRWI
jgi:putative membrane protein